MILDILYKINDAISHELAPTIALCFLLLLAAGVVIALIAMAWALG